MTAADIKEWVELILRWAHVFAAIMWVGATFYFTWLDGRFTELEEDSKKNPGKEKEKYVWMVHSGGFYLVEKQKNPQLLAQTLHWFKWEAATTWLTGFLLFGYMYYDHGLLVNFEDSPLSKGASIGLSLGMIAVGWVVYDVLWKFCRKDILGIFISYALIVAAAYVSCHYFSGRGAYLQLGAIFGTIMAANVWMRILPAQRRMVAALRAGTPPNLEEGARAKTRSKHNTFIVIPVVFIMISNHYPSTYGSPHNWIILSAIVIVGWIAAKIIRRA
ncbi:MAG TPA: urate hydroxylase PuuD [Verrucomicrobiae bacterium]|nr:urate hydroxylase PuuD [Verrucomicrobiae bacterium]